MGYALQLAKKHDDAELNKMIYSLIKSDARVPILKTLRYYK